MVRADFGQPLPVYYWKIVRLYHEMKLSTVVLPTLKMMIPGSPRFQIMKEYDPKSKP
jgi:hypothetical protein